MLNRTHGHHQPLTAEKPRDNRVSSSSYSFFPRMGVVNVIRYGQSELSMFIDSRVFVLRRAANEHKY